MKKLILLLILVITISCKSKLIKQDNKTFKISIKKSNFPHENFTNEIINKPNLEITALKINLRELLAVIIETDKKNIIFKDLDIQKSNYQVKLIQKKDGKIARESILNFILKEMNLKLTEINHDNFNLKLEETEKIKKYQSIKKDNIATIINNIDFVEVKNKSIKDFSIELSKLYPNSFSSEIENIKIDYKWKKTSLDNLRKLLKYDLGIILVKENSSTKKYLIEKN